MARYFPISLDIRGRRCLVVGGGHEAAGKAAALLEAGASVHVVSPDLHPDLARWAAAGRITWVPRPYRPGDVRGYFLVFACTDDPQTNAAVYAEAEAEGVLANAVDQPAHCHFIMPAVLRRGSLTVAITTDGKSPALAQALKAELAQRYGDGEALFLDAMGELRPLVLASGLPLPVRKELFHRLVASPARERARAGDRAGMYAALAAIAKEYGVPCPPEWSTWLAPDPATRA